jgi:hypothetical protein
LFAVWTERRIKPVINIGPLKDHHFKEGATAENPSYKTIREIRQAQNTSDWEGSLQAENLTENLNPLAFGELSLQQHFRI